MCVHTNVCVVCMHASSGYQGLTGVVVGEVVLPESHEERVGQLYRVRDR